MLLVVVRSEAAIVGKGNFYSRSLETAYYPTFAAILFEALEGPGALVKVEFGFYFAAAEFAGALQLLVVDCGERVGSKSALVCAPPAESPKKPTLSASKETRRQSSRLAPWPAGSQKRRTAMSALEKADDELIFRQPPLSAKAVGKAAQIVLSLTI